MSTIFLNSYLVAALWSSTTVDGEPIDSTYFPTDLTENAQATASADCADFSEYAADELKAAYESGYTTSQAGHDFWLTRNRHGAGFWDRGLGEIGEKLTEKARHAGSCYIIENGDGTLSFQ